MKLSILLHLYQPPSQTKAIFEQVFNESYVPLLKTIKSHKNAKFTISMPFSLVELMDKYNKVDWINSFKELMRQGKVELTGGAAYHPILTKLHKDYAIQQILLNEYGLGYFFGRTSGFEGENAVLIKDLIGFYPPEMAVSMDLLHILDDLSYKWVIADENSFCDLEEEIEGSNYFFKLSDLNLILVKRNTAISNIISFKRDDITKDIIGPLLEAGSCVIALDGEYFGHHNKQGILLLDSLLEEFVSNDIEMSLISEMIESFEPVEINSVHEASWGATPKDMKKNDIYPILFPV